VEANVLRWGTTSGSSTIDKPEERAPKEAGQLNKPLLGEKRNKGQFSRYGIIWKERVFEIGNFGGKRARKKADPFGTALQ